VALAGLVRARYRFLAGRFHPYLHLNIGGGEIRHAIDISSAEANLPFGHPLVDAYTANQYNGGNHSVIIQEICLNHGNCVDSITLGYLLLGGGGGLWYDIGSRLAFVLDVNLLGAIGVGGRQSGFNTDVSIGLGVYFF
jgi:hypothetical protein